MMNIDRIIQFLNSYNKEDIILAIDLLDQVKITRSQKLFIFDNIDGNFLDFLVDDSIEPHYKRFLIEIIKHKIIVLDVF